MSGATNHNKIINQAAREILKPYGLFQKGQSRLWIDDNSWFLILVEFQPSAWNKGTYLNVAIHYLWDKKDYLSFDYGHRENEFVTFDGDEKAFYTSMISLSEMALKKIEEYRSFKDISYAKERIMNRNGYTASSHDLYQKMMICGLAKDPQATKLYKQLIECVEYSELGWEQEYYSELVEKVAPIISDVDKFYDYIMCKINMQREFWHNKSSMKKLNIN